VVVAEIRHDSLEIPGELFEVMGRPTMLVVRKPDETGGVFIRAARLRDRVARRSIHRLERADGDTAVFRGSAATEGTFRIANYEPSYYLMPATAHDEFWSGIVGYHEHLPAPAQDAVAQRVSGWLARDVLGPAGESFLELGCGAGRNLIALHEVDEDLHLAGIDLNKAAVAHARRFLPSADVGTGSLYDVSGRPEASVDVVFTSGVLMHVPHDRVTGVVLEMHRIARRAVVHFELHGPSHDFDFHRYPRDYAELYSSLGLAAQYEIFPHDDFRSRAVAPFHHSLLVAPRRDPRQPPIHSNA
jgi:SAM-dependent methyltransferase